MRTIILLLISLGSACVFAQQPRPVAPSLAPNLSIERFEGSPVQVPLGFGIILNKDSTLRREWFVVRDAQSPMSILGEAGVSVIYKPSERGSSGQYQYSMTYKVSPKEPITAFEIRAVVIDAFGRPVKTLSATRLANLSEPRDLDSQWRVWSESEASEAFASVVYVAQVRTATGQVYVANRAAVFEQVRRVAARLSESDLEPKAELPAR